MDKLDLFSKLSRILAKEYTYFILLNGAINKYRMIRLSGSSSIHIREHFFYIIKFTQDKLPLLT